MPAAAADGFWSGPYEYALPPELIAQHPSAEREASRLMLVDRDAGAISHHSFASLPELLRAGDLLVANDSRVVPARLEARKESGGAVELLLLPPPLRNRTWALSRSSKPLRRGSATGNESIMFLTPHADFRPPAAGDRRAGLRAQRASASP